MNPSQRVHSRYRRHPWDLPWGRWPVQVVVHARRLFCDAPTCPRRIFVEPFPAVLTRYARQTERLRQALLELAHASNAETAARLARYLGYRTSPDMLIRRQRAERIVPPLPRVWGVDEFALRRGLTYATLLVDLERQQPVAVLEGRISEPLIKWLQDHPGVTILACDRAEAYALASRQAVPAALQVADRFHLVQNVSDALKTLLLARRWHQSTMAVEAEGSPLASSVAPVRPAEGAQTAPRPTPRQCALWMMVQQRRDSGESLRQIARAIGLDRRTVRKYLAADQPPVYPVRRSRPTQVTPYLGYLGERWAQDCRNARRLYQEIVQRGYKGSACMVRKALQPWRARPEAGPPPLTPAQRTWLLLRPSARLTEADRTTLESFLHANPLLAQGYQLKTRFQTLLAQRDRVAFDQWLQEAETSDLPSFQTVARSFRQDYDAITAALTTPCSTSQCEGQICRVKLLTRLGYGRAKLALLGQRILHRMAVPVRPGKQRHEGNHQVAA